MYTTHALIKLVEIFIDSILFAIWHTCMLFHFNIPTKFLFYELRKI